METTGSVTGWLGRLKEGEEVAAQRLWERYFARLVRLARAKLRGGRKAVADEEDVALDAFDSVCRGVQDGRFPLLTDRNNLWALLVVVTARKALNVRRWEGRKKRGGGGTGETVPGAETDLSELLSHEPRPDLAAQVAEELQRLVGRLGDEGLKSVALWKLEGYTNDEIAEKLGCAPRTVERRLNAIRASWEGER